MNKKIMILGASILQLPAIKKAKELGCQVIVVDMNPNAVGFSEPGIIKEVISTIDIQTVLKCARDYQIDGILTIASDMPMRTVAKVASELGLIGISCDTALKATNKFEMRKALEEHFVPCPIFYCVNTFEEYLKVVKKMIGPFIVKPADNSGSRGIYKIEDKNSVLDVDKAFRFSKSFSRNGDILVEEYMEGPEVSVETLTIDGVCNVIQVTDKLTLGAPHFVEIGHSQPSQLKDSVLNEIKSIAVAANKAIGIDIGPSHTEIIVTKDGPKIVEIGARLGGDCITTHLVPLSTGIDMVKCVVQIALGIKPIIGKTINKCSVIRYLNQKAGRITSIEGLEFAKTLEGIVDVNIAFKVGDSITDVIDSSSRVGFVISQDVDINRAIIQCEKARDTIKIIEEQ